ncbi:MAG: CARDB domain-containing protein [Candidatus Micrarchaeota archaeon]
MKYKYYTLFLTALFLIIINTNQIYAQNVIEEVTNKPNLVIFGTSHPAYPKVGEPFYMNITISNIGSAKANSFDVKFEITPESGKIGIGTTYYYVNELNIGEQHSFLHEVTLINEGKHFYTITVDEYNTVDESNEEDNTMAGTVATTTETYEEDEEDNTMAGTVATTTETYEEDEEEPPPLPPSLKTFTLKLKKGWNMYGIPLSSPGLVKIASLVEINGVNARNLQTPEREEEYNKELEKCFVNTRTSYYYDSLTKKYRNDAEIMFTVGMGLWMKLRQDCDLTFEGYDFDVDGIKLYKGWNQISGPSKNVVWSEIKGNCEIESGPWNYDTEFKGYNLGRYMEQGKGYFVKVRDDCELGKQEVTVGKPVVYEKIPKER